MVDEGKKNNIPIKKGNINELDLVINKQYNCVLAIDVFEHLDNNTNNFKEGNYFFSTSFP